MRITWQELAVDLTGQSSDDLLSEWRWLVPETHELRMVSTLGDAFVQDDTGAIHWLDVGGAALTRIADSADDFFRLRQQPENADAWFAPQLVGALLEGGQRLEPGQCFSYTIPLTLGGEFVPGNFSPFSLVAHFDGLAKIQRQVVDLPIGTKFSSVQLER